MKLTQRLLQQKANDLAEMAKLVGEYRTRSAEYELRGFAAGGGPRGRSSKGGIDTPTGFAPFSDELRHRRETVERGFEKGLAQIEAMRRHMLSITETSSGLDSGRHQAADQLCRNAPCRSVVYTTGSELPISDWCPACHRYLATHGREAPEAVIVDRERRRLERSSDTS